MDMFRTTHPQQQMQRQGVLLLLLLATMALESDQSRKIRDISGAGSTNGRIADFAMKALGSFQKFMKEGSPDLGIPSLDPVHMESFNYSLDNSHVGFRMQIQFNNPSLTGMSNYQLSGANEVRNIDGTKLQITVVFPAMQIKGRYRANGNLFGFFVLTGQGHFEILASTLVLSAEANLVVSENSVRVDSITSSFVGGRVKTSFEDTNNSGPFAALLNEFLNAMGSHVFDNKLKPIITAAMDDYMKEWLNGAFGSVTLAELLGEPTRQSQQQQHSNNPALQPTGSQLQRRQQQQFPISVVTEAPASIPIQTQNQPQSQLEQSPSQHPLQFQPFFRRR